MAVFYRLMKNNNSKSAQYGKWYAKAVATQVMGTDEIAEVIQRNCSVKKSDVKAVLEELVEVMNSALQDSKRVKLDGFGSFKIGLKTAPADSASEFNVRDNVTSLRVNFQPIAKVDSNGTRSKVFLTGTSVKELPKNDVDKDEE